MLETQERPSPESSIITIKNSKPAGKGEPSGICDGSFGSKSGPSPPNSCLLCLLSWLSSFFAINPQSNAYTLMIPVVAQGFHGEKPLLLSLHILCKVFCTRRLVRACSSFTPAASVPAALARPRLTRLQLAYTRNIRTRGLRTRSSYRCCDAKMSFQNVPSCLMSSMSAGSHCTSSSSF